MDREDPTQFRAERDMFAGVIEGLADGVLVTDAEGRILFVNEAARTMLDLGEGAEHRPLARALESRAFHEAIAELREGGPDSVREMEIAGPQIRRIVVRGRELPGGRRENVFFFDDVTERRQLETVRRDFVANVSHELRTPVSAIRGATETLLAGALWDPDATKRFIEIIERNSWRLVRLVEDLLDLSRVESREVKLNIEALDVREVTAHVVGLTTQSAEEGGVTLGIDVPDSLPPVRADRRAFEEVLANLLENGVKYAGPGATVTVIGERKGDMVRIRIDDTGPGIEKKHLPRLFERFYRVDAGRSREMGGTGLGLAIVRHLVEAMGGVISVKSSPGQGASFRFTLPMAQG